MTRKEFEMAQEQLKQFLREKRRENEKMKTLLINTLLLLFIAAVSTLAFWGWLYA